MPGIVQFAPDTFGAWLQRRGFESLKAVPALYRTAAQRLNTGDIAPNSPILPRFASELGVSLETLQPFAKAAPLDARWVQKIETQLAKGTLPRGAKTRNGKIAKKLKAKAKGRHGGSRHGSPLTRLLVEQSGMPVAALGKQLGISPATMSRLSAGQLGPNHPILPALAKALKLDLKTLTRYMHGPRMSAGMVNKARRALGSAAKAAARHAPSPEAPREATSAKAAAPAKRYNKLRGMSLALREATRAMIATLNVATMRGETHMPPIPLRDLYLVLVDYLDAKGVRDVLVDPNFATLFDPRS